jgi:EAL domain-containing protein (putative c-di-GMP-specific phosphodiesterase class I)
MGVHIAMDEFGTGYSSMSQLRSFPFNRIKIDRSFVDGAAINPSDAAIVRTITGLGAILGMRTTAKGVETAAQLADIRSHGCTEVQGFLVGRPVPEKDLGAVIAAFADGAGASSASDSSKSRKAEVTL